MSLDKLLRLAQPAAPVLDASELVRLASARLEQAAVLLAQDADGDDEDADDEDEDDEENEGGEGSDNGFIAKKKAMIAKKKGGGAAAKKKVTVKAAARSQLLEAMIVLSQLSGGEAITLSVLSAAERRKPSAHTIPGSTDFPIPDETHLTAAVREYHAGNLAGHSASEVAAHIRASAKRLGKSVDLTAEPAGLLVLRLAKGSPMVAMDHEPLTGEHSHSHYTRTVHEHSHTHNNDNRHVCGTPVYPGAVY